MQARNMKSVYGQPFVMLYLQERSHASTQDGPFNLLSARKVTTLLLTGFDFTICMSSTSSCLAKVFFIVGARFVL